MISGKQYNKQVVNVRMHQDQKEDKRSESFNAFFIHVTMSIVQFGEVFNFQVKNLFLFLVAEGKTEKQICKANLSNYELSKYPLYWG